jgi:hypothetical protein
MSLYLLLLGYIKWHEIFLDPVRRVVVLSGVDGVVSLSGDAGDTWRMER